MPETILPIKPTLPLFSQVYPSEVKAMVRQLLEKNQQQLTTLLAQDTYQWENLLAPFEEMEDELAKKWSPISHLHAVVQSEALRKAYNDCLPLLTEYNTSIAQNEKLFHAIDAIANSPVFATLNPAQRKVITNYIRDFKLAGVHLSVDKKAEFAALQQKLSHLSTQFSENLLDATHAWTLPITEPKQLAGLPPQALALAAENAKQRNLLGWVFTLDYPSYSTALKYLDDRSLRQQIYEAYATRASDRGPYAGQWDNSTIMDEIMATRHRLAQLVGFPNYAEYSLATKMAKTPTEVLQFLENLITKTRSIALQEKAALTAYAQNLDGITTLEAWDLAYYAEKLRESQFHFTQEAVRPYFPINKVLAGLFAITEKLYGVSIQEEKGIDIWHPDVRFFIIRDEDTGTPRGGFYIDLYARSHKRDGAWMDDCRVRRKLQNDAIQLPVAYLTCNFMPPVNNQPALLTHDDVLTLFHEFGHGLHHMLTKVDYAPVSGINGVPWDAVEFPSQFMENWCWEKETLALISEHYQTHEPIPDDLYQKLVAAKLFHTGLQMLRQLEFSLFDFRLHLEFDPQKPHQIQHLLDEIRAQTAVFPVPEFNRFQQSFSHVFAGGYAAGYYSYKWAEVLSADAYAQFEEKKDAGTIFNHSIGRSFLKNILESGGVRDPRDAFIAFRGREPHIDALLKHSGLEI